MLLSEQQLKLRRSVLIAGQFPPPVTGFAYITQEMAKLISAQHETRIIDLSLHTKRGGAAYHLHRMFLTAKGLWPLLLWCRKPERAFYIACEGNMGLFYTIKLCATARVLRYQLFIHHHSFGYIEKHSFLMACLVALAGRDATHIFLCQTMAYRFAKRYSRSLKHTVISNSAFVDLPPEKLVAHLTKNDGFLVIGLLSNLNEDKGLKTFLDLLRQGIAQGLNIKGVLAGPPDTDYDNVIINDACKELGERLDYRGAVYGKDKENFYNSIDVFVFPTRYANEAQPTVVFEAMSYGVPVLSYDRGCIACQVGECGAVIERNDDFIPFALDWLKSQNAFPQILAQLKLDAKEAFIEDRKEALNKAKSLFDCGADL